MAPLKNYGIKTIGQKPTHNHLTMCQRTHRM